MVGLEIGGRSSSLSGWQIASDSSRLERVSRKPKSKVTDNNKVEMVRLVFFEKNFMGDTPFMMRFLVVIMFIF